jgi:putative ABC transport system permease protein
LFDRVRAHPDVKSIGAINLLPFGGGGGDRSFLIEGQVLAKGDPGPDEQVRFITPGYFKTLEIPLLKGRDIDDRDVSNAPHVMVVNQALARKFGQTKMPSANAFLFPTILPTGTRLWVL